MGRRAARERVGGRGGLRRREERRVKMGGGKGESRLSDSHTDNTSILKNIH